MRAWTALVSLLALGALTAVANADHPAASANAEGAPAKAPPARSLAAATGTDRRYALANGCYALRSRSSGRHVAKDLTGYRASAGSARTAQHFPTHGTPPGTHPLFR